MSKNRIQIHDDWGTPEWFKKKIIGEFGEYFDPCPLFADFDGLKIDWGKVNYVNPPYSQQGKEAFVRKAIAESKKGNTSIILIPVSTSTKLFHDVIIPNAHEIRFLKGRIAFIGVNSDGRKVETKVGQHDSMLVIFKPGENKSRWFKETAE